MALDPARRNAATEVARQHPGMTAVALSPGIIVLLVVGFVWSWPAAIVLGLLLAGGGYYLLTRKK